MMRLNTKDMELSDMLRRLECPNCSGTQKWVEDIAKINEAARKKRSHEKIRYTLCSGSHLVWNGNKITLNVMKSSMQWVMGGRVAQGLFRNLMDVVDYAAIGMFENLCE